MTDLWDLSYYPGMGQPTPPPEVRIAPGSTRTDVAHTDPGVKPWPGTADAWVHQSATFSDGAWHWDGTAWVAAVPVVPGATVTAAHTDAATVPDPRTAWDPEDSATFSDGAYAWDGSTFTAWTEPAEQVAPGDTSTSAHDDASVVADPTTAWATGESATFSDGAYYWDGSAWVEGVAP